MPRTTGGPECPNCGAPIRDDGFSQSLECSYCHGQVTVERQRLSLDDAEVRRIELQVEREKLTEHVEARRHAWEPAVQEAFRAKAFDYGAIAVSGCGTWILIGAIAPLLGMAFYWESAEFQSALSRAMPCVAVVVGIIAAVVTWQRRIAYRRKFVEEVVRLREEEVAPQLERIDEIDRVLAELDRYR